MKVVKVDGSVFIGEYSAGLLSDAHMVGKSVTDLITFKQFTDYLCAKNMGKLMTIEVGAHSAVSSRMLDEEEDLCFVDTQAKFEIAKVRAFRNLENEYFKGNF